jgi:energy-coupling factor transporter ATP-binding protein EcfA2
MSTNGKQGRGITAIGLKVESFHRLRAAEVELIPTDGLIRVSGKNGAGKTSLLRAIKAALGGAGEILGEATVNEDAEDGRASVTLKLSNGFTVERRFTEAAPKGYLTVIGPDGGKHSQGKLAEWLGPLSFDPSAFFSLHPDRQREILLSLGEDPGLPAKLDELRAARAERYQTRTPWIAQQRRARQVQEPGGERPEPIDVSAELAKMGELQQQDRARQDMFRDAETRARQAEAAEAQYRNADDRVAELERLLEEAKAHAAKAAKVARATEDDAQRAAEEAAKVPDVMPDIEAVRARINEADRVQQALRPWEAYDGAQAELNEAEAAIQALTAEMEAMDAQERELIRSAGMPVEGLSFAEDGSPLLNGRPLSVASGAECARLAVAVAMAARPELRICLLDEEANGLDLDALEALDALAKEHGFQIWACRLGLEGSGEICVEDGEAWARDAGKPVPAELEAP